MLSTTTVPVRPLPHLSSRASAGQSSAIRELLSHARRPGIISLAGGLPDAAHFPSLELADIAARLLRRDGATVLQYGLTQGDEACRGSLAALFDPEPEPDAIVVTTGSQQALDLIARVMIDPGDQVVVGDPDYLGALQVFRSYGAELQPIAIDTEGLDTAQLETELAAGLRPKCLYLVPHFHNPTGTTITAERRSHLNELAARFGFLVIEDDPYRELFFADLPDPDRGAGGDPGTGWDPDVTVRLRSTSKTLAPGLRVGALAGPRWLTDAVVIAKQSADLHTSSLTQAIVAESMGSRWLDEHVSALRSLYRAKRDVLAAELQLRFGDTVEFATPAGGMFLWVRFRDIDDTATWLQDCLDHNVCFVPGAAFAITRDLSSHARLSFATGSRAELAEAASRLHSAQKS